MKDKLQALIKEQKALTAKFEELLSSTTEESPTVDLKKVFIKGHPTRGAEVIKVLEDLGGVNRLFLNGTNCQVIYRIDDRNIVTNDVYVDNVNILIDYTELHLPEEVSAENAHTTDIKVGDWIWVDIIRGYGAKMQNEVYDNNPHRITYIDSRHIAINLNGAPVAIFNRDKFHKVDPPTEEVELIEGEVYNVYGNIVIFKKQESHTLHTLSIYRKSGSLCVDETNGYGVHTKVDWIIATPEQRKQLFDALEKAGKHFDKDNMRLIDVEEWSCKQGLPIIVRNETTNWRADIFHSYDKIDAKYPFLCATCDEEGHPYKYAIPYDKPNADLIGTTDSPNKHYKFV